MEQLVARSTPPRHVWIMVPAAVVDPTIEALAPLLALGDTIIDGGNSWYHDDIDGRCRWRRITASTTSTSG